MFYDVVRKKEESDDAESPRGMLETRERKRRA